VQQPIENNSFIVFKLKFKTVRGLLDTGSVATIVSENFVKQHGLIVTSREGADVTLVSASGKALEIIGLTEFTVNINGLIMPIYARVARYITHDLILGTDFFARKRCNNRL